MGVTQKSFGLITEVIEKYNIKSICDLGAQNDYRDHVIISNPEKYPYISEYWKSIGVNYLSIDLNGENDSVKWNLDYALPTKMTFDLVCDFGTSEHVSDFRQCLENIHNLTKPGGIVIKENPLTGNWPQHGNNYVDEQFYIELAKLNGYEILKLEKHPAMGNEVDGWNQICVYKKMNNNEFNKSFPKYFKL